METTGAGGLLERLEALEARIAGLEAENGRLRARTASVGMPVATGAVPSPELADRGGRRVLLRKVLGATAAGALLALTREAESSHATARSTLVGATSSTIGLVAVPGSIDPVFVGVATGTSQHGVGGFVPATASVIVPTVSSDSGVLGLGPDTYGVQGVSTTNHGIVGRTVSTSDLISGIVGLTPGSGAGVRRAGRTPRGRRGRRGHPPRVSVSADQLLRTASLIALAGRDGRALRLSVD